MLEMYRKSADEGRFSDFPESLFKVKCARCRESFGTHTGSPPYGNSYAQKVECGGFLEDEFGEDILKIRLREGKKNGKRKRTRSA